VRTRTARTRARDRADDPGRHDDAAVHDGGRGGALLTRDADGMPFRNGTTVVGGAGADPVLADRSGGAAPGRVVQYGHGLLGRQGRGESGLPGAMANANGWVILASDWTGMKSEDVAPIVEHLDGDPTNFPAIPERSMQGFTEFIAAMRLMTGKLRNDPALTFKSPNGRVLGDRPGEAQLLRQLAGRDPRRGVPGAQPRHRARGARRRRHAVRAAAAALGRLRAISSGC
jgi:hypothetical protein